MPNIRSHDFSKPPFHQIHYKAAPSNVGFEEKRSFIVGVDVVVGVSGEIQSVCNSLSREVTYNPTIEEFFESLIDPLLSVGSAEIAKKVSFVVWDSIVLDVVACLLPPTYYSDLVHRRKIEYGPYKVSYTPSFLTLKKGGLSCTLYPLSAWSVKHPLSTNMGMLNMDYSDTPYGRAVAMTVVAKEIVSLLSNMENKQLAFSDVTTPAKSLRRYLRRGYTTTEGSSIPLAVRKMFYEGTRSAWIELFVQGSTEHVWDYDLISAYAEVASSLISTSSETGDWVQSTTYQKKAEYGCIHGTVCIYPGAKVSPFQFRLGKRKVLHPWGTWEGKFYKEELDFLLKHDLGEVVSIKDGWWFIPWKRNYLFKDSLGRLLDARKKYKGESPFGYAKLKSMAARVAGNFFVKNEDDPEVAEDDSEKSYTAGAFFNPVLYNVIVVRTTLKVAEFILSTDAEVACVTVDGVTFLDKPSSIKAGFKEEFFGKPALFPWPLLFWIDDREKTVNVKKLITEAPEQSEYLVGAPRRVTLYHKVRTGCDEPVGSVLESKRLQVGSDYRRVWLGRPETGRDLLDNLYRSRPYNVKDLT